jgi:hypothetical protein
MKMQLPVMDNRNNAVANPDSRKISDATMRCLAKCVACFGIGLYIFAGSDLPQIDAEQYVSELTDCTTLDELQKAYLSIVPLFKTDAESLAVITKTKDLMKIKLTKDAK